jgi:ankyrin repeat protein
MSLQAASLEWLAKNVYDFNDWSKLDAKGNHALAAAIVQNEMVVANDLLALNVFDVNQQNSDGNNCLWFACFRENVPMIDALIQAGVDINHQNTTGVTCLMYAASASKTAVVKALLVHGVDYCMKNQDDFTALDFAGNIEILRILKPLFGQK